MNLGNISVLWMNLSRIHVLLHTPYYEYTIKACNPKPAKKEVVSKAKSLWRPGDKDPQNFTHHIFRISEEKSLIESKVTLVSCS